LVSCPEQPTEKSIKAKKKSLIVSLNSKLKLSAQRAGYVLAFMLLGIRYSSAWQQVRNKDIQLKRYSKTQLKNVSRNKSSINNRTMKDALMPSPIA